MNNLKKLEAFLKENEDLNIKTERDENSFYLSRYTETIEFAVSICLETHKIEFFNLRIVVTGRELSSIKEITNFEKSMKLARKTFAKFEKLRRNLSL